MRFGRKPSNIISILGPVRKGPDRVHGLQIDRGHRLQLGGPELEEIFDALRLRRVTIARWRNYIPVSEIGHILYGAQ